MPTTSSYYSDLEYPTVNEDGTTYGGIINTYINELLNKLYTVSQRVTNAQSQLNSINQGVNAVDIINTTLAGAIGSNPLLTGTNTTLLPDPYSGTYTKTTTWPAYASSFSGYGGGAIAVPTTVSEINSFDFEGYKNVLLAELARIEAVVTQAEADILAAQQDTCRTKKIIEAYQTGGTTQKASETVFFQVNGITQFQNTVNYDYHSSSFSNGVMTVNYTVNSSTNGVVGGQTAAEAHQTFVTEGMLSNGSASTIYVSDAGPQATLSVNTVYMALYYSGFPLFPLASGSTSYQVTWYPTSSTYQLTVSAPSPFSIWNSNATGFGIRKRRIIEETVYPTPDFSSCTSPSPPYFIS